MDQTTNDGEKMEKQMWEDIKAKNWKAVESKIADGFQSVHPDGARDRAAEISLIKNLNVGETALSDLKSAVNGDNIVVTYMISAQETIDLERLPTKPAPRLSVWKKGASGWQWICHANLTPIP
ncbi:MAG: nuclear transport factor 2 family protein [Verrucomicrobia bacterium]|nr:MAG: nuclear transport factor 2 family protein [Verrucomicrobiota bacterium]PYJ18643.1 MAG: nuclear transport factor 2 family protein [Verrucomicrobiota bacterium]